jgi:hypothetical protein
MAVRDSRRAGASKWNTHGEAEALTCVEVLQTRKQRVGETVDPVRFIDGRAGSVHLVDLVPQRVAPGADDG